MWRTQLDVVLGLCICTREAIKSMKKNNIDAHIFHINSLTRHKMVQMEETLFTIYLGTKHAVTALTESIQQEINHQGLKIKISVSKICLTVNVK